LSILPPSFALAKLLPLMRRKGGRGAGLSSPVHQASRQLVAQAIDFTLWQIHFSQMPHNDASFA
jgi:hypothetical protein